MINIYSKYCKTPLCQTRVSSPKYEGYCYRCYIYTFPDRPTTLNYKTKEKAVSDHILERFSDYDKMDAQNAAQIYI